MGRQSARDSRQFREYGIKDSVNMIKAIEENKAGIIEKLREQKNSIKIARKEAAQKKKKKKKKPQQQKKRIKPQMEVEVIKEPRGAHDLGVIKRINTKKSEADKMGDIKSGKKSYPPRGKYTGYLPGSLTYIKDER